MKKRIISVILVLLLVLPLCFITAFAAEEDVITYQFQGREEAVLSFSGNALPSRAYILELWVDGSLLLYTNPLVFSEGINVCMARMAYLSSFETLISYYEENGCGTIEFNCSLLPSDKDVTCILVPFAASGPFRPFAMEEQEDCVICVGSGELQSGSYVVDLIFMDDPSFSLTSDVFELNLVDGIGSAVITLSLNDGGVVTFHCDFYTQVIEGDSYYFIEFRTENLAVDTTCFMIEAHVLNQAADSVKDGLMNQLSAVISSFFLWISMIAEKIVSEPLLLVTVGIFFVGACIGIFGRVLTRD